MNGVCAALWLLGLLAAAPALRAGAAYGAADRVRDALVLGVAIPLALGLAGVLYPATCWIALAVCLAVAYRRRSGIRAAVEPAPYLLVAALALVAWPQLMRPVLDGDSLSYHLPNAAAWVHAHGLWTTDGRYWWYPPASELFAAATFAVSGPFAVGWSGFGALALLGLRIFTWARDDLAASTRLADALAAATVTAAPLALQAGSLQNDVWLAAFFLEALWAMQYAPQAAAAAAAVTALIKPYGWIFALAAAAASRAPLRVWLAAAGALTIWIVHDAILWHGAVVAPASTSSTNTWPSTIAAHGLPAFVLLARVLLQATPFGLLAVLAAVAGPALARGRGNLGWVALAAVAWFVVMPLAYADHHPQLATGASLRYLAPAIALGALLLTPAARRATSVSVGLLAVSAAFGAACVVAVYWNDAPTRTALGVAILAVGVVAATRAGRAPWAAAAGLAAAVIASWCLAVRHPVDYYADALSAGGKRSDLYAWIARTHPPAIGGLGLRIGAVNVLSPETRAIDLPDDASCASARREHVLLVAVAESDRSVAFDHRRLHDARACGTVRFDDGSAVASGL